jgi:S1-C subfamily serine protease
MLLLAGALMVLLGTTALQAGETDAEPAAADTGPDSAPSNSVVRIAVMAPAYDPLTPWARLAPQEFTASGCVIAGQRILASAHCFMREAGVIRIQRPDGAAAAFATVERLNPVIDLAVLKAEKAEFFEGLVPLPLAQDDLPSNGAPVNVVGFPNGDPAPSVCAGTVIDVTMASLLNYFNRKAPMLKLAVPGTAHGSSGSPVVLAGNRVAGILSGGNTNEVLAVPAGIIRAFLAKKRPEDAGGSCRLGIEYQDLVNRDLRAWKKLAPGQTGQLITRVAPTGPAAGKLMVGDVMTAVDGLPIDDDGTIALPGGRRMPCSYHFMHRFGGDTLRISVARDGKPLELGVPATAGRAADLAPDGPPPFYLHAGLVFMPLTRNLAQSLCSGELNDSKIHLFSRSILQKDDDPAVVVGRVLPDEITEKCEPVVGECV